MGELQSSIHVIGSPDLDLMNSSNLPSIQIVKDYYHIPFDNYAIVMFHPVTTDYINIRKNAKYFVDALLQSVENYIVIYPNNDLGTDEILEEYKRLENNPRFKIFPSLRFEYFLRLLKETCFIIGNSSAGVREAPYYNVPTIDVGSRQNNRGEAASIVHVNYDSDEILLAIDTIKKKKNIIFNTTEFGNGNSNELFFNLLTSDIIWEVNCQKQFQDL
jgi:UDP-N-acetylglucosamine 2-epimerase (hydrolysing)